MPAVFTKHIEQMQISAFVVLSREICIHFEFSLIYISIVNFVAFSLAPCTAFANGGSLLHTALPACTALIKARGERKLGTVSTHCLLSNGLTNGRST